MAKDLAKRFGVETGGQDRDVLADRRGNLGDADVALSLITPTDAARARCSTSRRPTSSRRRRCWSNGERDVPDVQTAQELRWVVGANTTFAGHRRRRDPARRAAAADRGPQRRGPRGRPAGEADVAMFDLPAADAIVHARSGPRRSPRSSPRPSRSRPRCRRARRNVEAVGSALRAMQADGTIDDLTEQLARRSRSRTSTDNVPLLRTDDHDVISAAITLESPEGRRVGVPRAVPRGDPRAADHAAGADPGDHRPAARRLPDRAARTRACSTPGSTTIPDLGQLGLLYLMFVAGVELDLALLRQYRNSAITFGLLTFSCARCCSEPRSRRSRSAGRRRRRCCSARCSRRTRSCCIR